MRYPQNLIDLSFGEWLVVARAPRKAGDKQALWLCRCSCGVERAVRRQALLSGSSKTCGHPGSRSYTKGPESPHWRGVGWLRKSYWSAIQRGALKRGLEVSISMEAAWELFEKQKGRCALSDLDLKMPLTTRSRGTASLDRIDSSQGYVPGNVQWVHKDVNQMKMDLPEKYFIELCDAIARKGANSARQRVV